MGTTSSNTEPNPVTERRTNVTHKKKKTVKQSYSTKREYKVPISNNNKTKPDINQNSTSNSKVRLYSNKSNSRHRVIKHTPSAGTIDKTKLKLTSINTSHEKSVTRRGKLIKKKERAAGWTSESGINKNFVADKSKPQTKIPPISRHLMSVTAHTNATNSRFDGILSPDAKDNFNFSRSNTQGKIKWHLFSPGEPTPHRIDTDHDFSKHLVKANTEISMLRQELSKKNNELLKLKKFGSIGDRSRIPNGNIDTRSPNKTATSVQRRKIHSRPTNGNKRTVNERERSNSQSDEYYETTKVSPTSSYSTSVYSKGISHIKSSQSCRLIEPEQPVPFQNLNLQAVKESEEEQMTETFTKANKKFSQPQQKEIGRKNTPRQNDKNLMKNESRGTSRDRASTNGTNSRKSKALASNTKAINKKALVANNVNINFNLASKPKMTNAKNKTSENTLSKIESQDLNLPNINKKIEGGMKFGNSLSGFATRSLSSTSKLKIQKGKLNLPNTGNKNDLVSNPIAKNSLINVPKKYQYRGKRLIIDNQSVSKSSKSRITWESFKNHNTFHTNSGPIHTKSGLIQTDEALNMKSNDNQHLNKNRKLKLKDYRQKGFSSPSEDTVAVEEDLENNTNHDYNSVNKKTITHKVVTSKQGSSRNSVKPEKIENKKKQISNKENIGTEELTKKRLELLQLDEDDEAEFLNKRTKKHKQAKISMSVSDSIAQSQYNESQQLESDINIKNKVLSIDSKMCGSLLQGNF
jgi:hypothetical protein